MNITGIEELREAIRYCGITKELYGEKFQAAKFMLMKVATPELLSSILDQLEAERQRADAAHKYGSERDSENESLMLTVGRLRVEIAELKGEQVPVAEIKFHPSTDKHPCMYWFGKQDRDFPVGTRFFTAPQKPVVLPGISELIDACDSTPAMRDIHVWDLAISEVKRLNPSLFSDKSAAGGIVKDGE